MSLVRYWDELTQEEKAKLLKERLKKYTQKVDKEMTQSCFTIDLDKDQEKIRRRTF
jgi:hypothetical protein